MKAMAIIAVLAAAAAPTAVPSGSVKMLGGADAVYEKTALGTFAAQLLKSGGEGGSLYVSRVRYAAGERSPTHVHPDPRIVTVARGTILIGSGATLANRRMMTGETFLVPAGMPHYGWARDGAAELQEVGSGPSGTMIVPAVP